MSSCGAGKLFIVFLFVFVVCALLFYLCFIATYFAAEPTADSIKCSLRQCKNTNAEAEQFWCGYKDCDKKIHRPCFQAFLSKNSLAFLPENKYCCGVKAHHASVLKASINAVTEKTRWDADGPNGPNTEPNSMSILLSWWTTEGNYSKYRGGKDQSGKTKEAYWQMLSQMIKDEGVLVERSAQSIGSKIIRMESMYKEASDWLAQTGQGVLAEGGDVTDAVQKRCPFFYIIEPIMCDRPSIKPLALSDDLILENLGIEDELTDDTGDHDGIHEPIVLTMVNEADVEYIQPHHEITSISSSTAATATNMTAKGVNSAMKTPKKSNNQTSKRMLTISGTTSSQKKKKVDPFAIMSQLNGTLQNLTSSDKEEKMLLLESKYKSEELKLRCREIDIMERKSEIELKLLLIQEKKQLLQARKELKDQGIDEVEINMLLPLK
jgi:hypothetical protein